ncbi:MAG: DUF2325 domain-containing protein [Clostridiales bacterium]|mgnify:CR=1 FL=1|nr:DUF2325 domain-containing protein [Clostridiales bacterium]
MSVVIVGGNECMERQYADLCKSYSCKVKVFTKTSGSMKGVGNPNLVVIFTGTVSHKMLRSLESEIKGRDITVARSRSGSMTALRTILEENFGKS